MNPKQIISVCLFHLIFSRFGICQPTGISYNVEHFTDENGLPQNSVSDCALLDDNLWIATQGGITRFDGQHFTTFGERDSIGSASQRVMKFKRGINDTLYALTSNRIVIVIKDNALKTVSYNPFFHGSFWYYASFAQFEVLEKGPPQNLNVSNAPFTRIYDSSLNASVLVYHKRIAWYKDDTLESVNEMGEDFKRSFVCVAPGHVYYLGPKWEFYDLAPKGKTKIPIRNPTRARKDPIQYFSSENGLQYIVTPDSIYNVVVGKDGTADITSVCAFNFHTNISTIIRKKDGTLIIGTVTKGLFVLRPPIFFVAGADLHPGSSSLSEFYAQTVLPSGMILTNSGVTFNPNGSVNPVYLQLPKENKTLYTDSSGYTWYADKDGTLLLKQKLPDGPVIPAHRIHGGLISLIKDKAGTLWIGTSLSLARIDAQGYTETASRPGINYIEEDDSLSLLLGTTTGLYRIDKSSGQSTLFEETKNTDVRFIKKDRNRIWFSTYGNGFGVISSGKVCFFPLDRSEYLKFSHSLVEDLNDFFWIPTNKGIFQTSKAELEHYALSPGSSVPYYFHYNVNDGLLTNEFNGGCQPAYIRLSDGTVSLPSMNGLVWFDPSRTYPTIPTADIRLSSCVINNDLRINITKPISVPRHYRSMRLSFSTTYWGKPETNTFSTDWSKGQTRSGKILKRVRISCWASSRGDITRWN